MTAQTLPEKKDETYKYTDLDRLTRTMTWGEPETQTFYFSCGAENRVHDRPVVAAGAVRSRALTLMVQAGAIAQYIHHVAGSGGMLGGVLIDQIDARVEAGGRLEIIHAHLAPVMARTTLNVHLSGAGAVVTLNGVQFLHSGVHGDLTVQIHHEAPETKSVQRLRHVVDAQACGVYQGKVVVGRAARGAMAEQNSKAILLSPQAEMNTRPELEIYVDDVSCSHGATTGALDPDQIFYLMARGVPRDSARALLVSGFVADCLAAVPEEIARDIEKDMDQKIGGAL